MIISGFAGIGKTTAQKMCDNVLDLESSNYKWIYPEAIGEMDKEARKGITDRVQNPEWPINYVNKIKEEIQNYEYVLTCMDIEVRNLMVVENLPFTLAFPSVDCKKEYIQRLHDRGNNSKFIQLITDNYDKWINELIEKPQPKIILEQGQFLPDVILKFKH